jgi:deoxyuridine 5'-triphosphate nucleotidohydrolase
MAYYELKIFVDSNDTDLLRLYETARDKHNALFFNKKVEECDKFYDAGFDIFTPGGAPITGESIASTAGGIVVPPTAGGITGIVVPPTASGIAGGIAAGIVVPPTASGIAVDMHVKCSMKMFTTNSGTYNVGYYLYPRSSTGTKTPLRLSNSVGIIDSGYRGNITAVFDNIGNTPFTIEKYQRLVQICPPNLSFPFMVTLVGELSGETIRRSGGFGSTGK